MKITGEGVDGRMNGKFESKEPLPVVRIKHINSERQADEVTYPADFLIEDIDGSVIGEAELNIHHHFLDDDRASTAYLNTIKITGKEHGRGYGKAAYIELMRWLNKHGLTLISGYRLSRGAAKIWESLTGQGLAIKVDEGVIDETAESGGYSTAQYEAV